MAGKAAGMPTKSFFVEMLTRDIDLKDAILDLLDNCLDGVVRSKGAENKRTDSNYYSGFFAEILIGKDLFSISDNCGGIPRDTAEKYAFRMGRSSDKIDEDLPTVGIYGIGMKRAIFKIGRIGEVVTRNNGAAYKVSIPASWATEDEWDFPIEDISSEEVLPQGGTEIRISEINQIIGEEWSSPLKLSFFIEQLSKEIRQCYSFIIQKGFQISINGSEIEPVQIQLLLADDTKNPRISPYVFKHTYDDVNVSLAVGFYASPPSPDEIDEGNSLKRTSLDAGWTVLCNDRVVLYNDKSHLTGWGEAGVPQYHTQFTGIRGIVMFESNNPKSLPMTTTKRGIDLSSKVYSAVKDKMRQGMQLFTDYTNRWKGQNEGERVFSSVAHPIPVGKIFEAAETREERYAIDLHTTKTGRVYNPSLPKPPNDKLFRIIHYSRDIEEISDVTEYLFHDRDYPAKPSQVGEICFERTLREAHSKKGL
ncbi:MAG: ATP-binding protein [Christensenella sp.]|nr:ATP-binding protein [Christensenella sp.]